MSNFVIALLVAVSFGTWVYTKQMRRSGNNTKGALAVAGITALITFVVVLTVAVTIDSSLKK